MPEVGEDKTLVFKGLKRLVEESVFKQEEKLIPKACWKECGRNPMG